MTNLLLTISLVTNGLAIVDVPKSATLAMSTNGSNWSTCQWSTNYSQMIIVPGTSAPTKVLFKSIGPIK